MGLKTILMKNGYLNKTRTKEMLWDEGRGESLGGIRPFWELLRFHHLLRVF